MATVKGGRKLEQALRELSKAVSRPATLRVGFLEGATYPDGTPVAMVAAIQNYGAPRAGIPPRPFFTNMVKDKSREWGPAMARLLQANDMDVAATLRQTGHAIEGQLRQAIIDTSYPPNAPSTIRKKGFDAPLRDTMHMVRSIDHEVVT